MCMAIPFYLGGYVAIDMCVGSLILFGWQMYNKQKAKDFGPAVASGLICGDSLWGIPESILALAGVKAPFSNVKTISVSIYPCRFQIYRRILRVLIAMLFHFYCTSNEVEPLIFVVLLFCVCL